MPVKRKIKFIVRIGKSEFLVGYQNTKPQPTGLVYAPYVVRYKKPKVLRKNTIPLTKPKNLLQLG